MLELFHGGLLETPQSRMWLSTSRDYAASFAQLHDQEFVWALTVDIDDGDVLDLSGCGLDAAAVAVALQEVGLPVGLRPEDRTHHLLWRIPDQQIREAGYRAVRLVEAADWGNGPMTTVSLCLVDVDAVKQRSQIPLE